TRAPQIPTPVPLVAAPRIPSAPGTLHCNDGARTKSAYLLGDCFAKRRGCLPRMSVDRHIARDDGRLQVSLQRVHFFPGSRPLPEERRAHAHQRGPFLDGRLEVVAHAHGQLAAEEEAPGQTLVAQLAQPDEVRADP